MQTTFNNQKKVEENISSIFSNKGIFSAVGEKTINNYKSKYVKGQDNQPNLHYFAIGHTFKNIDAKRIFDYQLTDDEKDTYPTKYLSLQQTEFKFGYKDETKITIKNENLYSLIDNIRNINAHFIHDFEFIKVDNIEPKVLEFINESFEIALIKGIFANKYGNKKQKLKLDFLSNEEKDNILTEILNNLDKELIQFIKEIFYQTLYTKTEKEWGRNAEYNKQKKHFLDINLTTKKEWIDWILFNNVAENIEWELNPKGDDTQNNHKHKVLDIKKGKYLSAEGCLFIMTMFLYANEANYLIPKLKGFKKNGTPQDTSKLEVFRFFAKRFKSQDIDSENNQLVKFRDMAQYLGKFPVKWNENLLDDNYYTKELKTFIVEKEIETTYKNDINNYFDDKLGRDTFIKNKENILKEFVLYGMDYFFNIKSNITSNYANDFKIIIETSAEFLSTQKHIKDINKQLAISDYNKRGRLEENKRKLERKLRNIDKTNFITIKLKQRIKDNLLFISNGRNNDRFMDFASRYLAEVNYFGKDTQFKMYENFFTQQEQDALESKKEELSSKEFDKLHYHGGKLTHFVTYEKHLEKYPDWDTPFVVQNNAIYVKVEGLTYQKDAAFCIQRDLMNYLLEHALEQENPENKGKDLLLDYYKVKNQDFLNGQEVLNNNETISSAKKTELKKLFPKRLLHHYSPANSTNDKELTLKKYLDQAIESEKRYEEQKKLALADNRLDLFLNKNKGKQYKLKFIFKAWQLMFFREQYNKNKEGLAVLEQQKNSQKNNNHEYGHHKNLNITREEYNLFSKWMFAMDDVPQYKKQLENLLNSKGVFENQTLKHLFDKSNNLEQIFNATLVAFENWLQSNDDITNTDRFKLDNYTEMMAVGNININLSHFLEYAAKNDIVKKEGKNIIRPITKHVLHLYQPFYNIDLSHENASNTEKNLFRKLYKNRLEDCLLYEIATRYLQPNLLLREETYNHLSRLLVQDIPIPINNAKFLDNQNNKKTGSYKIIVPFKDLEKFAQLQYFEENNERDAIANNRNYINVFKRIPEYLKAMNLIKGKDSKENKVKDIEIMIKNLEDEKYLTLANISMLNNHLITQQGRFTLCIMSMEEYFIWKTNYTIEQQSNKVKPKNRIVVNQIPVLKDYFKGDQSRNNAFHMDLQIDQTYKTSFLNKEKQFVSSEVKANNISKLEDCSYMLKNTLLVFMGQMHDEIKMKIDNRDTEEQKREKRKISENNFFKNLLK